MRAQTGRAIAVGVACALGVAGAQAQKLDPRRGKTIIVGTPRGASPADRVDAARTGESRAPLPTGTLHVAWRRSLGLPIDAPPLVDARGDVTVLTARGDLIVLAPDGEERTHTAAGSAATTPAGLLSDGTAVFLTSAGDAVGVRLGDVRFRTHVGGGRRGVAPLALSDGGFVVATLGELLSLDGEGNVRARAALDPGDAPAHALVGGRTADGPTVYAVTEGGAVLAWVPASGREAARIGSFGGPTDGGVALALGGTAGLLVGVVGSQLVALDPVRGVVTTRGSAAASGALVLLGPPATRAGVVSVLGLAPSRTVAISFNADGSEALHQAIAPSMLTPLPDGGLATGTAQIPAHLGTLVDPHGDIAFALPSGELGVVSPSGAVDVLPDVCARFGVASPLATLGARGGPTYAGLAPAAPAALVVTCGSGVVARVDSDFAPAPASP